MLKKPYILIMAFILFFTNKAFLSAADYNDDYIPLRLKIGVITEAEFPEAIANVTKGISSSSLQIESLGNKMFLLPLENIDTDIHVVTRDNLSYCLHLIMDEIQAPTRIKINKHPKIVNEEQDKKIVNTIELMKVLLSGKMLQGAVSSKLQSKEIFNNAKFRITADEVYELPGGVKAFVLTFENLEHKPVVVPIEHIELPGLLAISIDSQILEARPRDTNKKKFLGYFTKAYMIVQGQRQ